MDSTIKLNFVFNNRLIYTKDIHGQPGQAFHLQNLLNQLPKSLKKYYVSHINGNCSTFSKVNQSIFIYVKPYIQAKLEVGTRKGKVQSYPLLAKQHENQVNLHNLLHYVVPPQYRASEINPALNRIKNHKTYHLTITPIKNSASRSQTEPHYKKINHDSNNHQLNNSHHVKANCSNQITFFDLKKNKNLKSIVMSGRRGQRIHYLDKVPNDYKLVNPRRLSYKPNAKYILLLRPRQHKMVTSYIVYFDYTTKKLIKYQTITGLQHHTINYKALLWDKVKDGTYHFIKFGSHHKTFNKGAVNTIWITKSSNLTTVSNYYIDYQSNQLIKHTLKHYVAKHYFNITTDKVLSHKYIIDKIDYYYTHQHITNMIFISDKANLKSSDTTTNPVLIHKIKNKSTALVKTFKEIKHLSQHDAALRKQAVADLQRLKTKNYNLQHLVNYEKHNHHSTFGSLCNAAGVCFIIGFLLSCLVIALS